MPKYRIEYAKKGFARFLSHLELLRTFNRALRRSSLPLNFTRGFRPRPKVSYGPPLAVGIAGLHEYLDFELTEPVSAQEGLERLAPQLSAGLTVRRLAVLPPAAPTLSKFLNCAWYQVALQPAQADTAAWQRVISELTEDPRPWLHERPKDGKVYDVKAGVKAGRAVSGREGLLLDFLVLLDSRAVPLRELLEALWKKAGAPGRPRLTQVTRIGLFQQQLDGLVTPLGDVKQFD